MTKPWLRSPAFVMFLWAALLVYLFLRGYREGVNYDFIVFWESAQAIRSGTPLYVGDEWWQATYLYGPIFALWMQPFLLLSQEAAYGVWLLGSVAALAGSVWLLCRSLPNLSAPLGWSLLAVLILILPILSSFHHANSNTFMLLLLALGLAAFLKGHKTLSGVPLALAACLKVAPLIFLPWLLVAREWRASAGFVAGLVLWLALVPIVFLGFERTAEETRSWLERVVVPVATSEEKPEVLQGAGASLPRIAEVFLAKRPTEEKRRKLAPPLASLSPESARRVGLGIALVVILVTFAGLLSSRGGGVLGFGLVTAAMLLASPVSRVAHFVQLYPLVFVVLVMAVRERGRRRAVARGALAAGVGVMVALLALSSLLDYSSKAFFPVTGLTLCLWGSGLWLLRVRQDEMAPTSAE